MRLGRGPLYLTERAVAQGGGLAFTALLVRTVEVESAAVFLAAYALSGVLQPLFANALQPLAILAWRKRGWSGVLSFWIWLQGAGLLIVGPMVLIAETPAAALVLLHAVFAPCLILSAPLAAEDRFRRLALTLTGVAALGAAARIGALAATGDLALAAAFFAVEPLVGGALMAVLGGLRLSRLEFSAFARPPLQAATGLVAAMGVTALFWRSPILLADWFLDAESVVEIALAMQIVMGLALPAGALCQSLVGPLARRDRAAAGLGVWIAVAGGIGAPAALALFGAPVMDAIYGSAGEAAAPLATLFAPMAGFSALWRLSHVAAGLAQHSGALAAARCVALIGQVALAIVLAALASPTALLIAAWTPLSMAASTFAAPLLFSGLRQLSFDAIASAAFTVSQRGRRSALRLLFA